MNRYSLGAAASLCLCLSHQVYASEMQQCTERQLAISQAEVTVGEIRALCAAEVSIEEDDSVVIRGKQAKAGVIAKRVLQERQSEQSEFVLTAHKMNYILPVYTTSEVNPDAYQGNEAYSDGFKNVESQFQLSLKFPLSYHSMFVDGDRFYGAFTLEAWWQVYASDISSPFRETNYTPELFYIMPLDWHPNDANTGLMLGIEHQSNGRSGSLSRSWNRVFAEFIYEQGNLVGFVRPWYRLPEDEKSDPTAPGGDDNPDIEDYMGHAEWGLGYDFGRYELSVKMHGNVSTRKGAIQANLTTPLYGKLKGYVTLFNGYGDSLIDYNHNQTRVGIGIALNNMF